MADAATETGTDGLNFEVAATAASLRDVRKRLSAWLYATGVHEHLVADVVMAVNEACSNSIEHGYRDVAPGPIRVEARLTGQTLHVSVSDSGSWKTPTTQPTTRSRGLPMLRAVSDNTSIDQRATGTQVAMQFSSCQIS